MIDLTIHPEALERNVEVARKNHIILPTFEQMKHPELIPDKVKEALKNVGLWDVNPLNLFRITWHNEPVMNGGQFGGVNYIELPSSLTGVKARIFCLIGKWFPTGCHKVGASYGCLVPRLVTGQFDATYNKAVWPSTGNYCRGGAFNSKLLACESVAILPAEMSKEGAVRLALQDRRRSHRHPRLREQCEGDLRQDLGAAPHSRRRGHLQPVRGDGQLHLALPGHRQRHRRGL